MTMAKTPARAKRRVLLGTPMAMASLPEPLPLLLPPDPLGLLLMLPGLLTLEAHL
jgi:hypothetical protein